MDEDWNASFSGGSSFGAGRGRSFDQPAAPVGKMASLSVSGGGGNGGWGSAGDDWNSGPVTGGGGGGWGSGAATTNGRNNKTAADSSNGGGWGSGAANSGDNGWDSGAANGGGDSGWGSGAANGGGDSGWGSGAASGGDGWGSGGGDGGWGAEATSGNGFDNDSGNRSFGSRGRGRGGGRGRGRGGASGGDRSCYKCGEEGHMSRECPSGGGDQRGGSRGFGGGRGASGGGGFGGDRGASGGGGFGGDRGGSGGGSRACFKCGEEGHFSRECPSSDAPAGRGRGGRGGGFGGAGGAPRPKGCFNCGSEEHSARDCDQDLKTRSHVGEDGKTREIYVPKDISDDSLFTEGISSGINFSRYQNIPCQVTGRDVVNPVASFDESGLRPLLLDNVKRSGYTTPTPVQRYALPIVMAGRDMMACAQTGSGKTAAFLLPILHELLRTNSEPASFDACQKPRAVIVSPTRELAMQIFNEARKFSHNSALRCVVVYGGTSTQHQSNVLQRGCDVLVATPGRLLDFVDRGKIQFERLRFLVLDEADRMLDMGFQGDVERITHHPSMPSKQERHTLLFSATFPEAIQRLAAEFLNNYLFVSVGVVGAASQDVVQTFCEVSHAEKRERLESVLTDIGGKKTLVFVELKRVADFIASHLCQRGFATTSIHGDRLQREREEALTDFKHGSTPTLIATSVASRGLDIKGVANVVNYDLPKNIDDYVHRIGRTGRVGNVGNAISFYDSGRDAALAPDLVKILAGAQQDVPDFLERDAQGGGAASSGAISRSRDIRRGFGGQQSGGALPQGFNANQPTHVEEEDSWN